MANSNTLISMKEAAAMTALSRTMIHRYRVDGRFPAPVRLGTARIAFVRSEIEQWIADRIADRDGRPAA